MKKKDTAVKHKQVKKLTPNELRKITAGSVHHPNDDTCDTPTTRETCLAYLVYP